MEAVGLPLPLRNCEPQIHTGKHSDNLASVLEREHSWKLAAFFNSKLVTNQQVGQKVIRRGCFKKSESAGRGL